MRILITGATGFLGSFLTRELLLQRSSVVRAADLHEPSERLPNVEYCIGDISSDDFCQKICAGTDLLYNFAAMPSIAHGKAADYHRVNVLALQKLLKAAHASGIQKVLHMSSSTVYGIPNICPIPEDAPLKPIGHYSRSKLAAEEACIASRQKGFSINIIRPRVIMGPGRIGIFSILFDRIMKNKFVPIIGDGKNKFQFTPVEDLVRACTKIMQGFDNEIFNIGCLEIEPVRDELRHLIQKSGHSSKIVSVSPALANAGLQLASVFGLSPLVNDQFQIAHKDFVLDTSKAVRLLGWKPSQSNFEAMYSAFEWYRENVKTIGRQYEGIGGFLGKFKHSKMGAFQK